MTIVVVAEKPSVARDIAACVGARTRHSGYLSGNGWHVTWAIGHLVGLAQPHEIDARWKSWRREHLPMLPQRWPLVVLPNAAEQFAVVRSILTDPGVREIVCATDAGREGELIFRFIYELSGARKPVRRLWISSLTPEAIKAGLARLRPARELEPLADAARARAQADWLVGMNLSRAYTLAEGGDLLSVGRVQTPTLALLVAREKEIQAFVPEKYVEVVATLEAGDSTYRGTWFRVDRAARADRPALAEATDVARRRLPPDRVEALQIVERVRAVGRGAIVSMSEETRRMAPPLLYDLTELQRHANRLFGWSAKRTLEIAQSLYEHKKLLTYPRTDSRHLSSDVARTLPEAVRAISSPYTDRLASGTGVRPLSARFVDDAKVSDHHAILPTATDPRGASLTLEESRLYDLVCRRLLMAWHDDHVYAVSHAITRVGAGDHFHTRGTRVVEPGWKVLDVALPAKRAGSPGQPQGSSARAGSTREDEPDVALPTALREGLTVPVREVEALDKETRPPKRLTEANLLTAMETAGAALEDKELSRAMKERGLGTPATRAAIIETLLAREYLTRDGKMLVPTDKGIALIDRVHPQVKSAAMTGEWEAKLRAIERGEAAMEPFMRAIEALVRDLVAGVGGAAPDGPRVVAAVAAPGEVGHRDQGERGAPQAGSSPRGRSDPRREAGEREQAARRPDEAGPGDRGTARTPPPADRERVARADGAAGRRGPTRHDVDGHEASGHDIAGHGATGHDAAGHDAAPRMPPPADRERVARADGAAGRRGPTRHDVDGHEASGHDIAGHGATGHDAAARRPPPAGRERLARAAGATAPLAPPAASARPRDDLSALPVRERLHRLLATTFAHARFRPHQEEVCVSVTSGQDALLVMPTGAGKSLCYQLPGLARGGTTLVVSPLIALIEDQVAKLQALGLRAARIHSGRGRAASRSTCADYLAGRLDFLFVAPERLAVPGFVELLARRPPTLVAIDEAHCISQWGHDFRPEYRMLGQRLPQLRPAPVIALTATATPSVQDDVTAQLGLERGRRFIHGFRRTNIAVEVVEVPKPERPLVVERILARPERRPALLYTSSRKEAEGLAEQLAGSHSAAAYHAGMSASARDRVQSDFMAGRLDVVAATIAFGMGVDKADIRTVVHLSLPQTVEGYYQEIGRAGRDGKPSRAILLHSFVDRRTHQFFLDRGYPDVSVLERVRAKVAAGGTPRDELSKRIRMPREILESAVEKLWIHGGVTIDADDVVHPAPGRWQPRYQQQRAHRTEQAEQMAQLSTANDCRMLHLVHHFGDLADSGERCGTCDVCAPAACVVQPFRAPAPAEVLALEALVAALRSAGARASGTVFRELETQDLGLDRDGFEVLVSGLARGGLLTSRADSFDKDGETIAFSRIELTAAGRSAGRSLLASLALPSAVERAPGPKKRRAAAAAAATPKRTKKRARKTERTRAQPEAAAPRARRARGALASDDDTLLVDALRAWRLAESKRRKTPAFRILTDQTLMSLAALRPASEASLLGIRGMGPRLVEKYGPALLSLIARTTGSGPFTDDRA